MEPDEEHFCEATGNEGASFERTYSRATLVIWPSQRKLAVINQGGPKLTLPYFEELLAQWQAAGPKRAPVFQQQAVELSGYMLSSWPTSMARARVFGADRDGPDVSAAGAPRQAETR